VLGSKLAQKLLVLPLLLTDPIGIDIGIGNDAKRNFAIYSD